jgi:hypothetical protein
MKSLVESVAIRKRTGRLVAFVHCAVAIVTLTGCAGQKEFERGYARGSGDTVKRQYWIQQNMQKVDQSKTSPYRLTLYRIPVAPDPDAKVKTVPYEIAIPIYE